MSKKIAIEKIAQPECRLPVINIFSQYLPERKLLADIAYSDLGRAMLFLVNAETLMEEKFLLPEGASCGFRSLAKGNDGKLYIGSNDGCLYSFDIDSKSFRKVSELLPRRTCCTGAYASASGKIYVGIYPDGDFFRCDPATGEAKRFSTLPKGDLGLYCTGFIDLPDGRMLIMTTGGKPGIVLFDPENEKVKTVYEGNAEKETRGFFNGFMDNERIIANYHHSIRVFNWKKMAFEKDIIKDFHESLFLLEKLGPEYYFGGCPSGTMYKATADGKVEVVKKDFPVFNMVNNYHHLGDDEFICIGDNGLVMRFNLRTGKMRSHQIDNVAKDGMGIQFLHKIPGEDFIVGSHFINSQMFRINISGRKSESSFNKVVHTPGQINCGTVLDGKFYLGSYIGAFISEYDWNKPFVPHENPIVIAEIKEEQNRPMDMVNDGKFIYIATGAEYGTLGGAISVLEPLSRKMEVYRDFVRGQNPTGLFHLPGKKALIGATDIFGDCGTAKPVVPHAVLFIWDIKQRKTVHTFAPWKIPYLKIISMSPSAICIGTKNPPGKEGEEYFLWDAVSGTCEIKQWPLKGVFIGGVFMNDREFYGATEHGLFILDVKTNNYEMLSKTTKKTGSYCTRCFRKLNEKEFLFDIEGVNVMKASIKK